MGPKEKISKKFKPEKISAPKKTSAPEETTAPEFLDFKTYIQLFDKALENLRIINGINETEIFSYSEVFGKSFGGKIDGLTINAKNLLSLSKQKEKVLGKSLLDKIIKSIDENLDIHLKKNNILIINSANSERTCLNANSLESGATKEHMIPENNKIDDILNKCKLLSKIMNIEYPELLKKLSEFNVHDLMKNLNNFDKNIDDIEVIHFTPFLISNAHFYKLLFL